jgi:B-Raf proto-oncogene serine/threonine-protein kinase
MVGKMAAVDRGQYYNNTNTAMYEDFSHHQQEWDRTQDELRNIQHHIKLTKDHIDALNKRFSNYQNPPGIFITEYEELTNKLHTFLAREQVLKEKINEFTTDLYNGSSEFESPPPDNSANFQSLSDGSPRPTPRTFVRAHLGNTGRTSVPVKTGVTLRDALSKAMKNRKMTPETCAVYLCKDKSKTPILWDTEMTTLEGEEIKVEVSDNFTVTTSISHNFVRKTFFSLAFCECCRRLLFQGFCCRTCGYKFHQRCAAQVPKLCQQVRMQKILVQAMLAGDHNTCSTESVAGIIMPGSTGTLPGPNTAQHFVFPPGRAPAKISSRDRSSSAPNVCANFVGPDPSGLPAIYQTPLKSGPVPGMVRLADYQQMMTSQQVMVASHQSVNSQHQVMTSHQQVMASQHPPTDGHYHHLMSPVSSPTKSSRSVSSSPTGTMRSRPRASSADDSGKKEIVKQNKTNNKEAIEDWEIPVDDIFIGVRIGAGSFGTVYRGHWHGSVAVKTLNVRIPSPAQIIAFRNEVAVLRKARHVNVLLFMGCVSKKGQLAIVTQWCEGSSLYKHLHVNESKFELLNVIEIARQTSQGMDYLHAKNIIHRDLKSNNIFLHDDNFTVKIGDFGLATVKSRWTGSGQFKQPTGSILWMAPEVIRMCDDSPYTFQSDIYAFGIVLYELLSGMLPYCHISNKDQILFMVGRGYLKPDLNNIRSDTPKALRRLLTDCIKTTRTDRPLFRQVLVSLENLMRSLPKIHRSVSEPILTKNNLHSEELFNASCNSPKTPVFN